MTDSDSWARQVVLSAEEFVATARPHSVQRIHNRAKNAGVSLDGPGRHSASIRLGFAELSEYFHFLFRFFFLARFVQSSGQLVVRAGICRLELNGSTQWSNGGFRVTLPEESFAQIVESIALAGIYVRCFFQMFERRFQIPGLQLAVAELVKDDGITRRMLKFLLVLCYGLHIAAETGVGEAEVIVAQWNLGIQSQRSLELFDCLHGAICIQVGASQQYVG